MGHKSALGLGFLVPQAERRSFRRAERHELMVAIDRARPMQVGGAENVMGANVTIQIDDASSIFMLNANNGAATSSKQNQFALTIVQIMIVAAKHLHTGNSGNGVAQMWLKEQSGRKRFG